MLDYDQSIELENDDKRVFASEENIHVANDLVVKDEEEAEREERSIL